jgi:ribosome biogenesis GTPase
LLGQVYKVQTDTYVVKCGEETILCNSRGLIKKRGKGIVVGDYVNVEKSVVTEVFKRNNQFIRPSVSNVDVIVVLVSPEPKPDFYLIDKVLVNAVKEGVNVVFAVNKTDVDESLYDEIVKQYGVLGYEIIKVSAKNKNGVEQLKNKLIGKLSVLVGQSAVGKTSLVNAMFNLSLKVGELSDIGRGKHTTTRSEIFEYDGEKYILKI